jgi:hypothetical protein
MEKLRMRFEKSGLLIFLIMVSCLLFGVADGGAMCADAISPDGGGAVHIGEGELGTATQTREDSERLLLDTIDKKILKIRPYDVELDQISRFAGQTENVNNQIHRHYTVDVEPQTTTVKTAFTASATQAALITNQPDIFGIGDTVFVDQPGYLEDGTTVDLLSKLELNVLDKDASNNPIVIGVNGTGSKGDGIPAIAVGVKLITAGVAGGETQMQTDYYDAVPTDWSQYLQKHMTQFGMSEIFRRADKEVEWNMTDKEEQAIFQMRRKANATHWFGNKRVKRLKNKHMQRAEDVYYSQGIWKQAGKEFSFGGIGVDVKSIVSLMKAAFTGDKSGDTKTFICGSDVVEALEQVDYTRNVNVGEKLPAYGMYASSIISKFGTLQIIHALSFADLGLSRAAYVLDVNLLKKVTMGWRAEKLDLRKSGIADADATVLMEICALVLKNPKAHMRVFLD